MASSSWLSVSTINDTHTHHYLGQGVVVFTALSCCLVLSHNNQSCFLLALSRHTHLKWSQSVPHLSGFAQFFGKFGSQTTKIVSRAHLYKFIIMEFNFLTCSQFSCCTFPSLFFALIVTARGARCLAFPSASRCDLWGNAPFFFAATPTDLINLFWGKRSEYHWLSNQNGSLAAFLNLGVLVWVLVRPYLALPTSNASTTFNQRRTGLERDLWKQSTYLLPPPPTLSLSCFFLRTGQVASQTVAAASRMAIEFVFVLS